MARSEQSSVSWPQLLVGGDATSLVLSADHGNCALVVLNQPLLRPLDAFRAIWNGSSFRVCADGGTNRLYDELVAVERTSFVPNVITGDLDSLRAEVRDYYSSLGSRVVQDHSQDRNDFQKALYSVALVAMETGRRFDSIIVVGGLTGRFDHTMSSLHMLYLQSNLVAGSESGGSHALSAYDDVDDGVKAAVRGLSECQMTLVCDDSYVTLLRPRVKNIIHINRRWEGPTCGFIPMGAPARHVTTGGMRWNVDGPMQFGGLVSTSNAFGDKDTADGIHVVDVVTSDPLLWTVELRLRS